MQDVYDIVKNVEGIYESNSAFKVLKDFERVLDELDIYVYDNWEDGELAEGPKIERHWVTCKFMWPRAKMPDPMGGKRLLDYDCKITYQKTYMIQPRKIRKPDDIRPGTKKGKLDKKGIWLVEIRMPKKLISDMFGSYQEIEDMIADPTENTNAGAGAGQQPADALAAPGGAPPAPPAPGGAEPAPAAPAEGV
tara:strand:+ start:341 stop:919 length:579 start_codon:yes stop_codon:yes gene_type:complete